MKIKKAKNILAIITRIFAWVVFGIAVITAVLAVFASLSGEKNSKEIFGVKILIVATDSMSKSAVSSANNDEQIFFDAGDLIIIKCDEKGTEYKEGDVIAFLSYSPESFGKTLTHKIKKVHYSESGDLIGYTTYGINTGVNDSTVVSPEMVLGSYSSKIPVVGNLFAYLKTPAGYYLSILTPSVLLIIYFSVSVGKYFGRKELVKVLGGEEKVKELLGEDKPLEDKKDTSNEKTDNLNPKEQVNNEELNEQNSKDQENKEENIVENPKEKTILEDTKEEVNNNKTNQESSKEKKSKTIKTKK